MSFRSITSVATPAHPLVIAAPAGLTDGDILVAWCVTDSGSSLSFTPPAGFSAPSGLPILVTADGGSLYVATKKAASESGSYSFSNSGSSDMNGGIAAFSGRHATLYFHRSSTGQQNTAQASPWTMTTDAFSSPTSDECDVIMIGMDDITSSGNVSHTAPSGHTVRAEPSASFQNSFLSSQDAVASGETGVLAAVGTIGGHSAGWAVVAIALLKAGGGGGNVTVNPTGLSTTASVGNPVVALGSVTVPPTGLALTASLGSPSIQANTNTTISPSGLGLTASVGAPTVVATRSATVTPVGLLLTTSLGTFDIEVDTTILPVGVGLSASLGVPVPVINNGTGSTTVTPTGFALAVSLDAPSIVTTSLQTPAGLLLTASIGTPIPTTTTNVVVTPSGLGLVASVGAPVVTSTNLRVSPAGFGLQAFLGTPVVDRGVSGGGSGDRRRIGLGIGIGRWS